MLHGIARDQEFTSSWTLAKVISFKVRSETYISPKLKPRNLLFVETFLALLAPNSFMRFLPYLSLNLGNSFLKENYHVCSKFLDSFSQHDTNFFLQILKVIAKLDRELFRCQLLYEIFFSHPLRVYIILGLKLKGP